MTVAPELVERFRADLEEAHEACLRASTSLAVAVSGGPDSIALLLLANTALPGRVHAVTVDHGLRPESAAEARAVEILCGQIGVPHTTLAVTVEPGNIQDRARQARYDAIGDWARAEKIHWLLTAHHADDQAETLMMRLNRGSGLRGLAGIRTWWPMGRQGILTIRPLLSWRKAELESVVERAGIEAARDPSNENARFDRTRIRLALASADWIDPIALTRSAKYLADADFAINWMVGNVWDSEVEPVDDGYRWNQSDQPKLIQLGIIERGIAFCGAMDFEVGDVARLRERISKGGKSNLAGVLVSFDRGVWQFEPEPPRRTG